ncbi:MAG TPA: glycosyltransferase family 1 protein [Bryobacteraceae bacterium]|nr:glycosyltransferase family 1 protein [Bryobacteraceae bacterium]
MKIALDATPLTVASGGVRRYTEELARSLAANFPRDEFWLLSDQPFQPPQPAPPNLKSGQGPRNALERRWWLWGLQGEISRLGIEVFHGTDFSVPYLASRPSVMTLHDLSPWMNPSWHAQSDRVRKRTPLLLRLGLATLVITHCEAVRRQAIDRFHLQPDRVVVVPLAANPRFHPAPATSNGRPYLLYVGTLEPRKNIGLLLDVWRELSRERPLDLVLAGRRREDFPQIPPEPGLRQLGLAREEDLPRLYSGALACLYPSYYEGFGLPVLEAMQCGAAVIASRDPAISEVAGDAAILLDAADCRAWVEALQCAWAQPERLQSLRDQAVARAAQFSWDRTAQLTRAVYDHAVERFHKA